MEGRYYGFAEYCRKEYGRRLSRIALDAGMTCPNRDGTAGTGGCIFCSGGSGDFAVPYFGQKMTREDFSWYHGKAADGDFIAYFQAYTNTYASIEKLKRLYSAALSDSMFAGISIATRPDAMGTPVMELLGELKERYPSKFIWIELGLQTASDETAELIRRGYKTEVYTDCAAELRRRGIPLITHMILGLPGENREDWRRTVELINRVGSSGVKLQLLHVLRGTELAARYESRKLLSEIEKKEGPSYEVLSMEEYVAGTAEMIAYLCPDIVIHRLTGDGNPEELLAPLWSRDKKRVLNAIRSRLKSEGMYQGLWATVPASEKEGGKESILTNECGTA